MTFARSVMSAIARTVRHMTARSSHVVHWDDVPARPSDEGDLRFARRRLGRAVGARTAGLSRYTIEPGARNMPVHVHGDEEEIFYVLDGSGLSWQDGATYAVGPGDCVVHRSGQEAHTLVAGDAGLDVLAFAEGSRSKLTFLPRAQTMWAGPHWVPVDGPHPFAAEVAAGPLEVPAPEAQRPRTIVALDEVPVSERQRGPVNRAVRDLGRMAGSERTGLRHVRIAPGGLSSLPHCHSAEEELFVVLSGAGLARLGDDHVPVRAGSVVGRPPATGIPHTFLGGEHGLELLAWGHRRPEDLVLYPEESRVFLRGLGIAFRVEPELL
jgi:uncharacterized cupin superfamily protein